MLKSNCMEFELTPEITDEIIFAMEDQTGHFLFDSSECRCVASPARNEDDDEDLYYAIPTWDSVSGFRMMDRFVAQLRNPLVREELRSALAAGQGVFRNFKNILKQHTEIERSWYQFKNRELRRAVLDWYNTLRDYWGLDRIGSEPEETEDIVVEDFSFTHWSSEDQTPVDTMLSALEEENRSVFSPGLSDAINEVWFRIRDSLAEAEFVVVAESSEGDVAGLAVSSPLPDGSFLSVQLSVIGVYPEFRGMGVGKELLARVVRFWADKGYRWLLFTCPVVPDVFRPALVRAGFVDQGLIPVLDLSDIRYH